MKDRTAASTLAPIPMPGRLAVERFDPVRKQHVTSELRTLRSGTQVTATGVLSSIRQLTPGYEGGRVHAVLTDENGQWALVDFSASAAASARDLMVPGIRVRVAALVQGAVSGGLPAGLIGYRVERPLPGNAR